MGNYYRSWQDDRKAAQRSAQIDRQIEQDGKRLKEENKVLLLGMSVLSFRPPSPHLCVLGLSESGKSTIVKQMRIVHQSGFSYETKMEYREAIYYNLLESAQAVAAALHNFNVEPIDPSSVVSSSDPSNPVSFFDPIPCSKRWNGCWNTISARSYSRRRVHLLMYSRVSLPRPYIISGKIEQWQSL